MVHAACRVGLPPLEQHERLLLEQSDTFTYQLHSHQLSYTTLHQSRDRLESIFVFHMFMSVRVSCVADSGSRNRAQSERLMQVNEENVQKLKTRRAGWECKIRERYTDQP